MLKFLSQVALFQEVTAIALPSSQESQISFLPLPTTHGITLEFCAVTVGVKSKRVVLNTMIESVVSKAVAPAMMKVTVVCILSITVVEVRDNSMRVVKER